MKRNFSGYLIRSCTQSHTPSPQHRLFNLIAIIIFNIQIQQWLRTHSSMKIISVNFWGRKTMHKTVFLENCHQVELQQSCSGFLPPHRECILASLQNSSKHYTKQQNKPWSFHSPQWPIRLTQCTPNSVFRDNLTHFMHRPLWAELKECTSIRTDDETNSSDTAFLSPTEEEEGRPQWVTSTHTRDHGDDRRVVECVCPCGVPWTTTVVHR